MKETSLQGKKPLLVFYLLVVYIILQFCWWAYLLIDLNSDVYMLKKEMLIVQEVETQLGNAQLSALEDKLTKRIWMTVGEGTVFIFLLVLGILKTREAFYREMQLANQQKNFLLSVTHELKTPLASVKLYLQTLLKRDMDKEKGHEIMKSAVAETERLNSLVENMLVATRIDTSTFSFQKENLDFSALVNEAMELARVLDKGRHIIKTDIQEGLYLEGDRSAITSVILNLVENAVKYSPEGTEIAVEAERQGSQIKLLVKDEGEGIKEREKKQVFKKFYRVGNETTRKAKGTGLGLFIVNYIVNEHGGSVAVKDNIPKGTVFEVLFPGKEK